VRILATASVGGLIGQIVPALGPAGAALILGVVTATVLPAGNSRGFSSSVATRALQLSITLLGLSVSAAEVVDVARSSIPIAVITVAIGLAVGFMIGRRLGIGDVLVGLLAAGTAICGGSAIAAIGPTVRATREEMSYSVSVIFFFSLFAVATMPMIGNALALPATAFAVWAGTAINDTASVLAASSAFAPAVLGYATAVKLFRTMLLLPTAVIVALNVKHPGDRELRLRATLRRAVPWVAIAFLLGCIANAGGLVPPALADIAGQTARISSVIALAAIGLSTNPAQFREHGGRPIAVAALAWVGVASSSIALIAISGIGK
jgi:uncharacterized integral membrane protein (TIGR00698 family)